MSRSPTVSVVMPMHNASGTVGEAIGSVQAQSLSDWELIAVDDSSSDQTPQRVRAAARGDDRIRLLVHEQNQGVSAARNTGLDRARGRYVLFLDADDWLEPGALELLIYKAERSGLGAATGAFAVCDEHGAILHTHTNRQAALGLDDLIDRAYLHTSSHLVSRVHAGEFRFDASLDRYEDLDFWLRLAGSGVRWRNTRTVINRYRISPGGLTRHSLVTGRACCRTIGMAFERERATGAESLLGDMSAERERRVRQHRMLTYSTRHVVVTGQPGISDALAALREEAKADSINPDQAASAAWFGIIFGLGVRATTDLIRARGLDAVLQQWWAALESAGLAPPGLCEQAGSTLQRRGAGEVYARAG